MKVDNLLYVNNLGEHMYIESLPLQPKFPTQACAFLDCKLRHNTGDNILPFPFPFAVSLSNFPAEGPNSGSGFALSYSSDFMSL